MKTFSQLRHCLLQIISHHPSICPSRSPIHPRMTASTTKRHYASSGSGYFDRPYVRRRTVMYVPGHDPKKLHKIPKLGVDCAVMECEDGVAVNQKAEARENIRAALDSVDLTSVDCAVRVNSASSGLMSDDMSVIFRATTLPQTILLPKVDSVEDLEMFTEKLQQIKRHQPDYCPYLITYVESAQGLMNMKEVLHKARQYSLQGVYHLDGVVFGSDDFCADIGAVRTPDSRELTYARQKIVMVAKAYRLQAIDMVFIDIKDIEGLRQQSLEGARKGYTGKQVIHPGQVEVVNDAFTPSRKRVEWATDLVAAFEKHQQSGKGAFTFHGHMIDMPLLLQAKNILQIVKNISSGS